MKQVDGIWFPDNEHHLTKMVLASHPKVDGKGTYQYHKLTAALGHGSNAAVESVILGTPVFVDRASAAALVGLTDLKQIENPVYPDRQQWLNNLAYNQWNEQELVDGTLWRMLGD